MDSFLDRNHKYLKEGIKNMPWINLLIAGLLEIFWALGLKYSEGFTILIPSILTLLGIIGSFYFVAKAMKTLPVGTSYAVFTGIGTAGTVLIGMIFLGETVSFLRIFFVSLLILGIIGLKLTESEENQSDDNKIATLKERI